MEFPTSFTNKVIKQDGNETIVRSNLQSLEDCNIWAREFGEKTNTKWNSRTSKASGERVVCTKRFVCHHSYFNKVAADSNKRSISKNTTCPAFITMKVKVNTRNTRQTDNYVKEGLRGIIKIMNNHNHDLQTAYALRFLPPSDCKFKFVEYFNDGMGIAEACKYHKEVLRLDDCDEKDMANSRINPSYRAVQYWHEQWHLANLGPKNGVGMIELPARRVSGDATTASAALLQVATTASTATTCPTNSTVKMAATNDPDEIELNINQGPSCQYSMDAFFQQILPVESVALVMPSLATNAAYNQHQATLLLRNDFNAFEGEFNYITLNQASITFPRNTYICLRNASDSDSAFNTNVLVPMRELFNKSFDIFSLAHFSEFVPDYHLRNDQKIPIIAIVTKQWNTFMNNAGGLTEGTISSAIEDGGRFYNVSSLSEDKGANESLNRYLFRKSLNEMQAYLFAMEIEVAYGILTSYIHTYLLTLTRKRHGPPIFEVSPVVRYNDHPLEHIAKFIQKALTMVVVPVIAMRHISPKNCS